MKLSKLQQKYNHFFKCNKLHNGNFNYFNDSLYNVIKDLYYNKPKEYYISKTHKKLLRNFGIPIDSVKTYNQSSQKKSIAPLDNVNVNLPILINQQPFIVVINHGYIVISPDVEDFNYMYFRQNVVNNKYLEHEIYSRNIIQYYTNDESLIFQYETIMDYKTIQQMVQLGDALQEYARTHNRIMNSYVISNLLQKFNCTIRNNKKSP